MDVASLIVTVQTKGVEAAQRELDKLGKNASNAEKSVGGLASSMKTLGALASVGAMATLAKEAIKMADVMTTVESRLKLVTKSVEEQTKAQSELFKIAQQTRLGFKETADLYSRIAISTKDYNLSQEKILGITNTINKAMIISGGTAESMNAAIMQLGQAFSGNFQSVGQELASIREQTPALYQAIVEGSGMTSQAFKKAAEDGELSAEIIIKALEKQKEKIDSDFTKISKTVGQSMTLMSNSMLQFVGEVDKSTGASNSLANSITSISLNIDELTQSIKNSNGVLDELSKKANFKIEDDGLLASILKVNQGAGDALYAVLAETLGVVDKTAGEWSKIIDSSYSGMGKWVKNVGVSLGVVEERAKATKKAIDSIVPQRPTEDKAPTKLVEDLSDRFSRPDATKKDWELIFDINKKAQDEILSKQKEAQNNAESLAKKWAEKKLEIQTDMSISEQDEIVKPFLKLELEYQKDLEEFKAVIGAKELLAKNFNAEYQRLGLDTTKKLDEKSQKDKQKDIQKELKLQEENFRIQSRQIELLDDEADRQVALATLERQRTQASLKAQMELGEVTPEYYNAMMEMEDKLLEKQKFNASANGQIVSAMTSQIKSGMDSFVDDAIQGSIDLQKAFKNVLQGILADIIKIQVTRPLSSAISTGLTGLFGGATLNAQGGAYSSPSLSQYSNQVVDKPTFFAFASGGVPNLGVMGEKNGGSAEAIMPLTRTSNGDLGVKAEGMGLNKVKIQIINESGTQMEVTKTSQTSDVEGMVIQAWISGISKNRYGSRELLGGR